MLQTQGSIPATLILTTSSLDGEINPTILMGIQIKCREVLNKTISSRGAFNNLTAFLILTDPLSRTDPSSNSNNKTVITSLPTTQILKTEAIGRLPSGNSQ